MAQEIKILEETSLLQRVGVVIGTRPGIVMFAPIIHELKNAGIPFFTIHTGQHYSPNMDSQFFHDLEIPDPEYKLSEVSKYTTHGGQTAEMLHGIEGILLKERPSIVMVGGDANTNLAGALAARKLRISVAHVEAGERSYDWRMPEEHNRRIIDHISDLLFTTGEKGKEQLEAESVQGDIYITGNPIVDASIQNYDIAKRKSDILTKLNLNSGAYAILTTHREENVDSKTLLRDSLEGVKRAAVGLDLPVIFPVHPRTQKRLKEFGLDSWAAELANITLIEAVGYLDFLNLIANAACVFTDSGGVQQEACIHHVPAVTLRENTEWTETLEHGANRLAGSNPDRIVEAAREAFSVDRDWPVPFGDGSTSVKITEILKARLGL